jgi:2-methylcitrate dehydratase PrpD
LLRLDLTHTTWAFGTAGTQAAGLWQYLLDAAHSKQIHTAKAGFNGLLSAYQAREGVTGPADILGGVKGLARSMSGTTFPEALDEDLGSRWAVTKTSFKWHASCRHTHPSVDGLLALMSEHSIQFDDILKVQCSVYRAAIEVLSMGGTKSVHHSKFSMQFTLALAAKLGRASINDFTEEALGQADLLEFMDRVEMMLDKKIDDAFPKQWMARVLITTKDGKLFERKIESPKGDPGNTLTTFIRPYIFEH